MGRVSSKIFHKKILTLEGHGNFQSLYQGISEAYTKEFVFEVSQLYVDFIEK